MPTVFLKKLFGSAALVTLLLACKQARQNGEQRTTAPVKKEHPAKPGSSFEDTLTIKTAAAVFFEPDSLQLQKIKAVTEEGVFKSTTHEYKYQLRYAHKFLMAHWKNLNVMDAKNVRFLLFEKADKTTTVIDLNKQDPCGLFVFDLRKSPVLIDMMNIDTAVPNYFSDTNKPSFNR